MSRGTGDRFPHEAVRDLLGLVRAIYAAAKTANAGRQELARIAKVGAELSGALELAEKTTPGTIGHDAAYRRAEAATLRVGELVDAITPAAPLIVAAQARVSGARIALRKKAPER
jgi:hypothetical protein